VQEPFPEQKKYGKKDYQNAAVHVTTVRNNGTLNILGNVSTIRSYELSLSYVVDPSIKPSIKNSEQMQVIFKMPTELSQYWLSVQQFTVQTCTLLALMSPYPTEVMVAEAQ